MPPRGESQSIAETQKPGSAESRTLSPEKVQDRRPTFREKFKTPEDYLNALDKLYSTDRDLNFWTKDNLRSLIADSGLAYSREDLDRQANELNKEVRTAQNTFNQVIRALFQSKGVQADYQKSFGQEITSFDQAKTQAASLLKPFYDLYSQLLSERTSLKTEPRESLRDEKALTESEDIKDTIAWEVAAIVVPPAGYSKREQQKFAARREAWDQAIAKLQPLPGPHQPALQAYLQNRNATTARYLIEQFPNLTPPAEEGSDLEIKFKREQVRDLEIFLEQVIETATVLASKLGLELKQEPFEPTKEGLSIKEAKDILGHDVLGPEAIEKSFGIKLSPDQIPSIPYTKEQLEKAKELGEMLILRIDKDKDNQPLTMQRINTQLQPRFTAENKGKILNNAAESNCWYRAEAFYTQDTPRAGWKLVSKAPIPDSTSKDYIDQTKVLRDHLALISALTPEEAQECTDEQLAQIRQLAGNNWENWQPAAQRLSALKINQNHRRIPVEVIYDFILNLDANNTRTLEALYDWTGQLSSSGALVGVGLAGSRGAHVLCRRPGPAYSGVGVSPAR